MAESVTMNNKILNSETLQTWFFKLRTQVQDVKHQPSKEYIYTHTHTHRETHIYLIVHIGSWYSLSIKRGNVKYIKRSKVTAQNINCSCLLIIWPL